MGARCPPLATTSPTSPRRSQKNEVREERRGSVRFLAVSDDPADVVPGASVILLALPVHAYRAVLSRLVPHIAANDADDQNDVVYLGTLYGQGGFNWMVQEAIRNANVFGADINIVPFAIGLNPWVVRVTEYGSRGVNYYGCIGNNFAVVQPPHHFDNLNANLFRHLCLLNTEHDVGTMYQADSFLSITMSVDNQITHTARNYALWLSTGGGTWAMRDDIPYFYRDFDMLSAEIMLALDNDYTEVRDALERHFSDHTFEFLMDYMSLSDFVDDEDDDDEDEDDKPFTPQDFIDSFTKDKVFGAVRPPTKQLPTGEFAIETNHRFFRDDVAYGLCICKWIAQKLNITTPQLDKLLEWAQLVMGEAFIGTDGELLLDSPSVFNSGIPPAYGLTSIDQLAEPWK